MRVEPTTVKAFTIYDNDGSARLDPVLVILQDFGGGAGRIVLECYGEAWSSYWGAMGAQTVQQFFMASSVDYLVNALWPRNGSAPSRKKHREDYLTRIVEAVRKAFAINCPHPNLDKSFVLSAEPGRHIKKCVDCAEKVTILDLFPRSQGYEES
jgi:hypothetical protein